MEDTNALLDAAAVGDLVLLDPLTEESLLRTLQQRFHRGDIYVGTGQGQGVWGGERGRRRGWRGAPGAGLGPQARHPHPALARRRTSGAW